MIKTDLKGDIFDEWVKQSNILFGYTEETVDFPSLDGLSKDDGIKAEWFYESLAGTPNFSELNAIRLYRTVTNSLDDVAPIFSGISLVEMWHYDHLSELIVKLGGKVNGIEYSTSVLDNSIKISKDNKSAILEAIKGEQATIEEYLKLKEKCLSQKMTTTRGIVVNILDKLIADETKHVRLFKEELKKYPITVKKL